MLIVLSLLFISSNAKIGIIVNKDLYPSIKNSIDQYIADLEKVEGKKAWLDKDNFSDRSRTSALKNALKERYQNDDLEGAVLIGDLPIPIYYFNDKFQGKTKREKFACDLYYMDLDGTWKDSANLLVRHTGERKAEIWVSRITASVLEDYGRFGTEIDIVNKYFARLHKRMYGLDPQPRKYVIAGQKWEWRNLESENIGDLGYNETNRETFSSTSHTSSSDKACGAKWLKAIKEGREYGFVYSHSSPTSHSIGVTLRTLRDNDIKCRFFNCYACSNADYERANMAGAYALTDEGLVSVGSSKTGSMIPGSFRYYNRPLGADTSFGNSYKEWFNDRGIREGSSRVSYIYWHYGMTLQGVGSLFLKPYDAVSIDPVILKKATTPCNLRIVKSQLKYNLPNSSSKKSYVNISLYTTKGILVKTLVNEVQREGAHTISLQGAGTPLPAGVYLCKLTVGNQHESVKFVFR